MRERVFDKGETFAGVPYELGLECAEEVKRIFGTDDIAPIAIKWVLMHEAVSVVIPGGDGSIEFLFVVSFGHESLSDQTWPKRNQSLRKEGWAE
jgi:hypothetical protein